MNSKLIEETKILPKKDRVKETINASLEDVKKLYKVTILYKLCMYFEKKFFNNEKEFLKEAHNLHQTTIKSVKCEFTFSRTSSDPVIYTIDGLTVDLISVLKSIGGEREVSDEYKEIRNLCFKYDRHRLFVIIPVFEKIDEDYWLYG